MLKAKENLPYNRLSEGEAYLSLNARNQELKALVAERKGNVPLAEFHTRAATHFRIILSTNLHNSTSLAHIQAQSTQEKSAVEGVIVEARKMTKPSITLSSRDQKVFAEAAQSALRSPIDEFDPTAEQLNQCRSDSATKALELEIQNGRTFDQGTFDPSIEQVHPVGTSGQLVVIKTANLRAREQRLFEACSARIVMENIVNKKLSDAGNLVIYRLMEDVGHDFKFNNKVNNRIVQQSAWITETAKVTGLSFQNILLVLENSAININEETPDDTLKSIHPVVSGFNPDVNAPVPTTLPPLSTEFASKSFVEIIAKVVVEIIIAIVDAIRKRRKDAYDKITDPSVIAARCIDANIAIENCAGLPPDYEGGGTTNSSISNTTLYAIGGVLLLGVIGLSFSGGNSSIEN